MVNVRCCAVLELASALRLINLCYEGYANDSADSGSGDLTRAAAIFIIIRVRPSQCVSICVCECECKRMCESVCVCTCVCVCVSVCANISECARHLRSRCCTCSHSLSLSLLQQLTALRRMMSSQKRRSREREREEERKDGGREGSSVATSNSRAQRKISLAAGQGGSGAEAGGWQQTAHVWNSPFKAQTGDSLCGRGSVTAVTSGMGNADTNTQPHTHFIKRTTATVYITSLAI